MKRVLITSVAAGVVGGWALSASAAAPTPYPLLTDNFSRTTTPANTPVGTPPSKDTTASAGWVSDWGQNSNYAGGKINQTYATYLESNGNTFKIDGTNGISGNWLNNGSPLHPLKLGNSGATITEPIGIPGFGWVQINHDLAANKTVSSGNKMRIAFDLYRTPGGNINWFFGNNDPTGVNNGTTGSAVLNTANDVGVLWRGFQSSTYQVFDNGVSVTDTAYQGSPNITTMPIPIVLEISGTNFSSGSQSTISMTVAGVQQDINGGAAGSDLTFTWDGGGSAYMGFGSNNTPVEGTIPAPVYRASGIDNLKISVDLLLGDMNKDGDVNNQDIAPFVLALTNLPSYEVQFPTLDGTALGDINLDGVFNNQDIAPFVAILTGGPNPIGDGDLAPLMALVPEPTSLSLLALGALALRRRR